MILLLEMTVAGERRVTDGKAQGVMVEEAQIQKLKSGWRMKRRREPIGLVLTGEQKKKRIEKDHQVIRRRATMHMIGWFMQISRIWNDGNMGMKEVQLKIFTRGVKGF